MEKIKSILSIIHAIVATIPAKGWLIIFAITTGVPTSLYGLNWAMFKFIKQETNCNTDMYYNIAQSKTVMTQQRLDELTKLGAKHSECLKSVSINKGSITFLKEERERQRQGRL